MNCRAEGEGVVYLDWNARGWFATCPRLILYNTVANIHVTPTHHYKKGKVMGNQRKERLYTSYVYPYFLARHPERPRGIPRVCAEP